MSYQYPGQPNIPNPGEPQSPSPMYAPPPVYPPPSGYPPTTYQAPGMNPPNIGLNYVVGVARSSQWALVSLICAIAGFFTGITFILAIIFGHMSLAEIKRNPNLEGRGLAIAGIAISYSMLGLGVISFILVSVLYRY